VVSPFFLKEACLGKMRKRGKIGKIGKRGKRGKN
jgi:hypothetical protein